MHIHANDPVHAQSPEAKADFQASWILAVAFVAVLGIVFVANEMLGLGLQRFGVQPRTLHGLLGVLAAPLLHADFMHLLSNALPLAIAGTAMLFLYPDSSRFVLPAIYVGPGVAVWLFGRDSVHIGASGLVYGLVTYVFLAGMIRRDRRAIAASLLVAFLYGALVWGVLPIKLGVSWETHLAAAVIGALLAVALRHRDIPPRKQYSWELEPPAEDADDGDEWKARPEAEDAPAPRA